MTNPIICTDNFTPHSKLRRYAAVLTQIKELCWMEMSGGWNNARLTLVWIGFDDVRYKTRLAYNLDNDSITEEHFIFEKVTIPTSVEALTSHSEWEPWLKKHLNRRGDFGMPGWRYAFTDHCKGLASRARLIFEAFGEHLMLMAYQSGWCENESDEATYSRAIAALEESIRTFEL